MTARVDATLAQARDVLDSFASLNPAIPADVVITQVDANGASAELLTPPNARAKRAIIYARGGSYTMGRKPGIWRSWARPHTGNRSVTATIHCHPRLDIHLLFILHCRARAK